MPEDINLKLIDEIVNLKTEIQTLKLQTNFTKTIEFRPIIFKDNSKDPIKQPCLADLLINHILVTLCINNKIPSEDDLEQYYALSMMYLTTHTNGNQFALAYYAHPNRFKDLAGFTNNDRINKYYGYYGPFPISDIPENDPLGEQFDLSNLDNLLIKWSKQNILDIVMTNLYPKLKKLKKPNRHSNDSVLIKVTELKQLWTNSLTKY